MNAIIKTVTQKASVVAGRTGLKLKKYSPEILLVTGTISIVGGVVLACKETLKVEEILDEAEATKQLINDTLADDNQDYTEEDAKADSVKVTIRTGVKLVKNYIPSASLILTGLACVFASYGIIRKRNVALSTAYTGLQTAFDSYREKVKEAVGEEREKDIRFGRQEVKAEVMDEEGKVTKEKVKVPTTTEHSPYARFFDSSSRAYKDDPEYNLAFLNAQEGLANNLLHARGHVFLNEIYDMLGFDRTPAGQFVGWALGNGDDYIDFGLYNPYSEAGRRFINGHEPVVLLDFNVDGPIYDKI